MVSHPERAVGNVDLSPRDDDGVLKRLGWDVDTKERAVPIIHDLNVNREAFCILKKIYTHNIIHQADREARNYVSHVTDYVFVTETIIQATHDFNLTP